jgi:adenine deaminase
MKAGKRIALGTDSAITAEGDMIDEMRVARTSAGLTAEEIYPSVTTNAAKALRLTEGQGVIRERGIADLVAVKDKGQTPAEALHDLHPELVLVGGRVVLASERFAELAGADFHPIEPETFTFLGFTHYCGKLRNGTFTVWRETAKKRMVAKLQSIGLELR